MHWLPVSCLSGSARGASPPGYAWRVWPDNVPRLPIPAVLATCAASAAAAAAAAEPRGEQPEAFRFEDPMFDNNYGMFKAYANSKLALLMFAEELQDRLNREKSNVIVNTANPGVRTGQTFARV